MPEFIASPPSSSHGDRAHLPGARRTCWPTWSGRPSRTVEHQSPLEFIRDTIRPWLVRWEQALTRDLIPVEDRDNHTSSSFLIDGLMRGDLQVEVTILRDRAQQRMALGERYPAP